MTSIAEIGDRLSLPLRKVYSTNLRETENGCLQQSVSSIESCFRRVATKDHLSPPLSKNTRKATLAELHTKSRR
jgi:hypothetical protein